MSTKEHIFLNKVILLNKPTGFFWIEKEDDLFNSQDSLAHCVSKDLRMGAGIAKIFRSKYNNVNYLKKQPTLDIGNLVYLTPEQTTDNKFIFYLITKEKYYQKPEYTDLWNCLTNLKIKMFELNISSISIPLIGCGLDKLNWDIVKRIIWTIFKDTLKKITVYKFKNV